jgi:hypothetical protein
MTTNEKAGPQFPYPHSVRKTLKQVARVLLVLLAVGIVLLIVLPDDTVRLHYPTLQAARADHVFDRGWLPDVLPPSSTDIRVTNNLDLNNSVGEFHFDPREYAALLDKTAPYHPGSTGGADEDWFAKAAGEPDMRVVESEGSRWLFLCLPEKGVCSYEMASVARDTAGQ